MDNILQIKTPTIRLDQFLKYAGVCSTGGEAAVMVREGQVCVGGEICTQRGKKLRDGDEVRAGGDVYRIRQSL